MKTDSNISEKINFSTTDEMIRRHSGHFFDRSSMRFFNSRVLDTVIHGSLFVTSEKHRYDDPRFFTIRGMDQKGDISTICKFQNFNSSKSAINFAKKLPVYITEAMRTATTDFNEGTRDAKRAAKRNKSEFDQACKFLFENLTLLDCEIFKAIQ